MLINLASYTKGVDTRDGAQDDAVIEAIINLHRLFRQTMAKDGLPLFLVQVWHRLKQRGAEMVSWLDGLIPADLERGKCSGCDTAPRLSVLPSYMTHVQAWLGGEPQGADVETPAFESEPPDYFNLPEREGISAVKEVFEGTFSLEAGETKKVLNMQVPPGQIVFLTNVQVGAPGVEVEIEADGKKFRL
ncbi:MAG: hypothetical protein M0Z41_10650 [Peptococcaceae bacterium]|nr:hypothetical protein [Peptococcaceae bacterium]